MNETTPGGSGTVDLFTVDTGETWVIRSVTLYGGAGGDTATIFVASGALWWTGDLSGAAPVLLNELRWVVESGETLQMFKAGAIQVSMHGYKLTP